MKFLTVLIIFFVYRNWVGGNPIHDAVPFARYAHWFRQRGIVANVRYLLCVGLPVLVTLLVSLEIGNWLLGLVWLVFAIAILLYSVDIFDEEVAFDDQAAWLGDPPDDMDLASVQRQHNDFQAETLCLSFQSLYPALFWFLVMGPAGALAYGLSRRYLDLLDEDEEEFEFVDRAVFFLEWPAARVAGLLFALVGHFGRCFEVWLESIADVRSTTEEVLVALASAAVDEPEVTGTTDIPEFTAAAMASNESLRELLDRSLFGWLGVAAVVAIMGL